MKTPTVNDLLDALRQYGKPAAKRPDGKGWMTLEEMAQAEKTTKAAIKYRINAAIRRGVKIEQESGTTNLKDGRVVRTAYYRLGNGTR